MSEIEVGLLLKERIVCPKDCRSRFNVEEEVSIVKRNRGMRHFCDRAHHFRDHARAGV